MGQHLLETVTPETVKGFAKRNVGGGGSGGGGTTTTIAGGASSRKGGGGGGTHSICSYLWYKVLRGNYLADFIVTDETAVAK